MVVGVELATSILKVEGLPGNTAIKEPPVWQDFQDNIQLATVVIILTSTHSVTHSIISVFKMKVRSGGSNVSNSHVVCTKEAEF